MDIWQTGSAGAPAGTGGWPWLDATGGDPRHASPSSRCCRWCWPAPHRRCVGAIRRQEAPPRVTGRVGKPVAWRAGAAGPGRARVQRPGLGGHHDSRPAGPGRPESGRLRSTGGHRYRWRRYPGRSVDLVARCVEAGVATGRSWSRWRLRHPRGGESGQQRLLGKLDTAVTAFVNRMANRAAGREVVVAISRSSAGGCTPTPRRAPTTAPPRTSTCSAYQWGGWYGTQPSLTDLDNGDLKVSTDFGTSTPPCCARCSTPTRQDPRRLDRAPRRRPGQLDTSPRRGPRRTLPVRCEGESSDPA